MTTILSIIKKNYFLIVILMLLIYHNAFINIITNINSIVTKKDSVESAEIQILKAENNHLKEEIDNLTKVGTYASYHYVLTKMSYRSIYDSQEIYIKGGNEDGFAVNYAVVNSEGLVGVVSDVNESTSKVKLLTGVPNLSVKINDTYGTLSSYEDGLLVISNISNYSKVNLNDEVYTSTLGAIKERLLLGTVYRIEDNDISKKIFVKSKVDFNNLNYLYVVGGE